MKLNVLLFFVFLDDKDLTVVFRIMSLLELYKWLVSFQTSPPAFTSKDKNDSKDDKV